jgi:peptidoglycan/LPS O-acetylase OafA/YrhL
VKKCVVGGLRGWRQVTRFGLITRQYAVYQTAFLFGGRLSLFMTSPRARAPWIDAIKLLAAQIIVWHHLCAYGPLADAAALVWPDLASLLFHKGRLAVQVFFVLAGYLAAQALTRVNHWSFGASAGLALKRYRRLVWPLCVALVLATTASAITRDVLPRDMVPTPAELPQLLAHLLLLQSVLGMESLSAGIWYVAIDFQLFLLQLLCFALPAALAAAGNQAVRWTKALAVGLMLASLWGVNLLPAWDNWAPYFFGSYGLGVCAFWASRSMNRLAWTTALVSAVGLALLIDFRGRILLAGVTALVVIGWRQSAAQQSDESKLGTWCMGALHAGAERSHALFLVHFPVLLLANGLWVAFPPWLNLEPNTASAATAMLLTWLAAWGLAHVFHAEVEATLTLRPAWKTGSIRPRLPWLKLPRSL